MTRPGGICDLQSIDLRISALMILVFQSAESDQVSSATLGVPDKWLTQRGVSQVSELSLTFNTVKIDKPKVTVVTLKRTLASVGEFVNG